jgi:RimJ/RimL family protein N-acetyltransferase
LLPWTIEGRSEVEVAYLLAKEYWGQGLATEAALAIVEYGFEQLGLSRLICLIVPENQASQKVAGRIGMRFEKQIEESFGPAFVYAISKPEAT